VLKLDFAPGIAVVRAARKRKSACATSASRLPAGISNLAVRDKERLPYLERTWHEIRNGSVARPYIPFPGTTAPIFGQQSIVKDILDGLLFYLITKIDYGRSFGVAVVVSTTDEIRARHSIS